MSTEGLTRHTGLVTSLSWIPTEAIQGAQRLAFDSGITHYDPPPPTEGMDVVRLRDEDRFRFANELRAFITVDGGTDRRLRLRGRRAHGHDPGESGRGAPSLPGRAAARHPAPARRGDGWVRFVQTCGGRTGVPAPRRVRRRPFVQWQAPLVWTTLSLTIHADGRSEHALVGASRFPRHWVYGADQTLSHKSGLTDFKDWYRKSFGKHSPWGDEDSEALVSAVETALETSLSAQLMQGGGKRRIERFPAGTILFERGRAGDRGPSDPRRHRPGRARRGTARRVRAGGAARRTGAPRGRHPHLQQYRRDALPRRALRGRPDRACAPGGAVRGAPPRGPGARRARACHLLRDPRLDARTRSRLHPLRWAHFVRRAVATTATGPSPADAAARRRHRPATTVRAPRRPPFRGTVLLTHLHWDHVQGLPFFRAGDRDDARVDLLLPAQDDGTDAEALLSRMMSPPFFPIAPSALRGRWRFGLIPGEAFTVEGFSVLALDVPHKGGRTMGSGSATSTRPSPTSRTIARRRSVRVPTVSASTTRLPSASPRASTS